MTEQHPITPPDELVEQWCYEDGDEIRTSPRWYQRLCAKSTRWGADQELEACCDAIYEHEGRPLCGGTAEWLRAARRPKPPSLKEQALKSLEGLVLPDDAFTTISRALKRLQELEGEQ